MSRRHYVYYRVAAADAEAAVGELLAAQHALCDRHPGLVAEGLRRPDVVDGCVTLMEVYHFGPAHDTDAVEREASAATARWRVGERHVEAFVALD